MPMIDGHDAQLFFKQHWKIIVTVAAVLVVIIVGTVVAIVITLSHQHPTTPTFVFEGPKNINGDREVGDLNSTIFTQVQTIPNPISGKIRFSNLMFVHQAGFIACITQNSQTDNTQSIVMLQTNLNGSLEFAQSIPIPVGPLGINQIVVNGCFAPIFNFVDEVYYLFITIGVSAEMVPFGQNGFCSFGTNVLLFSYATDVDAPNSRMWVYSDIRSKYIQIIGSSQTLKIPYPDATFQWNASQPWIGSFGDNLQCIYDDNDAIPRQSLYIRGSQWTADQPGGAVYWFVIGDNTATPELQLNFAIKDAKLALLKQQYTMGCNAGPPPTDNMIDAPRFANSWGSSFSVTSGLGANNILLIGNASNEDYDALVNVQNSTCGSVVSQGAQPGGYVQGFILNSSNVELGWVQSQPLSELFVFNHRYPGARTGAAGPGAFGYSCYYTQGFVIIGYSSPNPDNSSGVATFEVWDFQNSPTLISQLQLDFGFSPSLYRGVGNFATVYNQIIQTIENNLLVSVFNQAANTNAISILNPNSNAESPFAEFKKVQDIGSEINSGIDLLFENTNRVGFGQGIGVWYSRTFSTLYMVVNDPFFTNDEGRIILLAKIPQA